MILIGDIHGNFDTLVALLAKIPESEKAKGIICVGDLIDRGPKSREVVEFCINNNIQSVRGNHEDIMIDFLLNKGLKYPPPYDWFYNGGGLTLSSYGSESLSTIDLAKFPLDWLVSLPYYKIFPDIKDTKGRALLVTHSAAYCVSRTIINGRSLNNDEVMHLIWDRPSQNLPSIPGFYNVFGHTRVLYGPEIRDYYANLDTGCYRNKLGNFKLSALQFPEMTVYNQENIDTVSE